MSRTTRPKNTAFAPVGSGAKRDAVAAGAVDVARDAAMQVGGAGVGSHLGVTAEDERVVTHAFEATMPGYRGWYWAVTVARAPRAKTVTVDEVVLLPGTEALLAKPWVPWSQRLRPGDLRPGDVLPAEPDDERLVPGYVDSGDSAVEEVAWELGLGRARVMSQEGRTDAAHRWYSGDSGPDSAMARHAHGQCSTCGFFLPLAGSLRSAFGVCGNEIAPSDGRVVSVDHGCGAHSEAIVEVPSLALRVGEVYEVGEQFELEGAATEEEPLIAE